MAGKQRQVKSRKNQRAPRPANPNTYRATTARPDDAGNAVSTSESVAPASAVVIANRTRPYRAGKVVAVARAPIAAVVLTREQEYGFIRSDLRRLVLTSGALTVVMLLLLFLVDR